MRDRYSMKFSKLDTFAVGIDLYPAERSLHDEAT
jgi:hypothetical protein